jgi:hypothetical protein
LRRACFEVLIDILDTKDSITKEKYCLRLKDVTNIQIIGCNAPASVAEAWEKYL